MLSLYSTAIAKSQNMGLDAPGPAQQKTAVVFWCIVLYWVSTHCCVSVTVNQPESILFQIDTCNWFCLRFLKDKQWLVFN